MCMIDYADEPFVVHREQERTSRRVRECGECGALIAKGDRYHAGAGLFDGRWSTYTTCMACWDGPCAWLEESCGGWLYLGVMEDLEEHWADERHAMERSDAARLGWIVLAMRHRHADAGRRRLTELRAR